MATGEKIENISFLNSLIFLFGGLGASSGGWKPGSHL
jgi:hypothetical protein